MKISRITSEEIKECDEEESKESREITVFDHSAVKSEIDKITDLQLRDALQSILAAETTQEIPPVLAEKTKFWLETNFQSLSSLPTRASNVRETFDFFYEYFKAEPHNLDIAALKSNGPLAINLVSFSLTNPDKCQNEMHAFCEYMEEISQKPRDIQETYFKSFPPKTSAEIACIGGTGTRTEELKQSLKVSTQDKPFLDNHQLLMSQITDRLKYHVYSGNQIHILPYLNFALGLESKETVEKRDPTFTAPQFDIPVHILWDEFKNYAPSFRERLTKSEVIDQMGREAAKIKASCSKYSVEEFVEDFDVERVNQKKQDLFNETGVNTENLFVEDVNGDYQWIDSKIANAVVKKSWPRVFAVEATPPSPDLQISGADLFSKKTVARLAKLLQSEDQAELQSGVEALWMLGTRLAGNSPIQLVAVINSLNEIHTNYIAEVVKPKLTPNYQYKADLITENYNTHAAKYNDQPSLKILLEGNAPQETLQEYIAEKSPRKLAREFLELNERCYRQLTFRPDNIEIFQAAKDRGMAMPIRSMAKFIALGAEANDTKLCTYLLNNFPINHRIFKDQNSLVSAAKNNNSALMKLFIEKGASQYINHRDSHGMAAIHLAALDGNVDHIKALKTAGADMNLIISRPIVIAPLLPTVTLPIIGNTAAHLAAREGRASVIEALHQCGANLDLRNDAGMRPLQYAIAEGYTSAAQALIAGGARINLAKPPPLFSINNPVTVMRNIPDFVEPSLARSAVRRNHTECFQLLETNGINISRHELSQLSELAVQNQNLTILKSLLKKGASVPYGVSSENAEITDSVRKSRDFFQLSLALLRPLISSTENPSIASKKTFRKFTREVSAALISTYDFDLDKAKEDFGVRERVGESNANTAKIGNLINSAAVKTVDHSRVNSIAQSLREFRTKVPSFRTNVEISSENKASILEILSSRANIRNAANSQPNTSPLTQEHSSLKSSDIVITRHC